MRVRTGIDVVFVPRIKVFLQNKAAVQKTFHHAELSENPESCAGVFAAKEAFFKAVQQPPRWLDIEIKKEPDGRPFLKLHSSLAAKLESHDVSISHDGEYAVASVVLVLK